MYICMIFQTTKIELYVKTFSLGNILRKIIDFRFEKGLSLNFGLPTIIKKKMTTKKFNSILCF